MSNGPRGNRPSDERGVGASLARRIVGSPSSAALCDVLKFSEGARYIIVAVTRTHSLSKLAALLAFALLLSWGAPAEAGGRTCLASVKQLKDQVTLLETFKSVRGGYPANLDELAKFLDSSGRVDPWGTPLTYRLQPSGFLLGSSGPDLRWGTPDDLVYGPELRSLEQRCFAQLPGAQENDEGVESRGIWLGILFFAVASIAFVTVTTEMYEGQRGPR